MRTDLIRIKKYKKKVRGLVLPLQKSNFSANTQRQVEIENITNIIVGPDINRVYYIIFAKEINKLFGKYTGDSLLNEVEILQSKWTARGLNPVKLDEIKSVFNIVPAPTVQPFKLDISLLDGPDILS